MSVETSNKIFVSLETLSKLLQDSIKSIIKKAKYKKYDITIKNFDTRGNNFIGELYEIDITGDTVEGIKNTYIFVKQQIPLKNLKLFSIKNMYTKEVFIYKDLSKIFTSLQDVANVPQKDRYKIINAYEETDDNAIILENLSKKGFRTYEKLEVVSIKYAQLAVQEMAKFHALNFIVERKMPEYHNSKIKVLKNVLVFDDEWKGLMRNICAHVASLYDNDVKKRIEKFSSTLIEKLPKYLCDQSSVKRTLNHGDFKKNNLLVRVQYEEVVEIVPVDYQLTNYGPPIKDFLFFIFTSTDRKFRKKHLKDLKELYFGTLSRFLLYFDMDVETVYPRKEFEKVYTEWLDFGLMITLCSSFVIFTPDTGILIDDFIEWGYL